MSTIYETPASIKEIFETGEASYRIIDYSPGMDMDNIEAMKIFLEHSNIPTENIKVDDGTQVTLTHPDFEFVVVIDSYGLGDFFSHGFDVSLHKEVNGELVEYTPGK